MWFIPSLRAITPCRSPCRLRRDTSSESSCPERCLALECFTEGLRPDDLVRPCRPVQVLDGFGIGRGSLPCLGARRAVAGVSGDPRLAGTLPQETSHKYLVHQEVVSTTPACLPP